MRELTSTEIEFVGGAGRNCNVPTCYSPSAPGAGFIVAGAVGGAVALGIVAAIKLKLFALALC